GVAAGILAAGLAALEREYGVAAWTVAAWWGPAIGPCCFAVGEEVVTAIGRTTAGPCGAWALRDGGGLRVDLRAALTAQAQAVGVPETGILSSTACTACDATFHSYRRARGGGGRMLAYAGRPR
ncbi:MAG: laccase domain-containing protein, partial [Gemmatimonadota bacterium]